MSQHELLIRVIRALDETGAPYMLTGSFASSLQGEPRLSHDIDFVVKIQENVIPAFVRMFPPPEFYLDQSSAQEAVRTKGMFNLLHVAEGGKVDFWLLTEDPFDISRFARRKREEVLGLTLFVSTAEDTILAKLRWAKLSGGSEKQFHDVLRVYQVQSERLDMKYLLKWVEILDLGDDWERVIRES